MSVAVITGSSGLIGSEMSKAAEAIENQNTGSPTQSIEQNGHIGWNNGPVFVHPPLSFLAQAGWLHLVGRGDEARGLYEKMLERLTPAGLLSEDTDFITNDLWGNYPQTYSLVGLNNCAGLLSRPWTSVR